MSIDPVTFMDTGDTAQFNRYAYGNNDPVNMLDPDGRDSCSLRGCSDQMNIRTGEIKPTDTTSFGAKALAAIATNIPGVGLTQAIVTGEGNIAAAAAGELPQGKALKALDKVKGLKSLTSKTKVGETVKTPANSPESFTKLKGSQGFKDNKTGTIMQKSKTNHSQSPGGEFKAGVKPGQSPTKSQKVTISGGKQGGCVIKKDGC